MSGGWFDTGTGIVSELDILKLKDYISAAM
jgi:hypothetical protein